MDIEQLKIFKINVVERSDVKQERIPSLHEVLGPILTGFYYISCEIKFQTSV